MRYITGMPIIRHMIILSIIYPSYYLNYYSTGLKLIMIFFYCNTLSLFLPLLIRVVKYLSCNLLLYIILQNHWVSVCANLLRGRHSLFGRHSKQTFFFYYHFVKQLLIVIPIILWFNLYSIMCHSFIICETMV
jgi:hypothetical protein